ncbi:MAG: YkgJ family cysteine cluster protein [Firmicutes bacterium]|nr:YkgJ family cysteine cluster protein [Bacillota bacterium]
MKPWWTKLTSEEIERIQSKYTCRRCGTCCRTVPGFFESGEEGERAIQQLADHLALPVNELKEQLLVKDYRDPSGREVWAWRPRHKGDQGDHILPGVNIGRFEYPWVRGICVFYDQTSGCTIHPFRPLGCRLMFCASRELPPSEIWKWMLANQFTPTSGMRKQNHPLAPDFFQRFEEGRKQFAGRAPSGSRTVSVPRKWNYRLGRRGVRKIFGNMRLIYRFATDPLLPTGKKLWPMCLLSLVAYSVTSSTRFSPGAVARDGFLLAILASELASILKRYERNLR